MTDLLGQPTLKPFSCVCPWSIYDYVRLSYSGPSEPFTYRQARIEPIPHDTCELASGLRHPASPCPRTWPIPPQNEAFLYSRPLWSVISRNRHTCQSGSRDDAATSVTTSNTRDQDYLVIGFRNHQSLRISATTSTERKETIRQPVRIPHLYAAIHPPGRGTAIRNHIQLHLMRSTKGTWRFCRRFQPRISDYLRRPP